MRNILRNALFLVAATVSLGSFFLPASAASVGDIAQIIKAVEEVSGRAVEGVQTLTLQRVDVQLGAMELRVVKRDNRTHFGIQAGVIVGAKESNYDLDTPCVGQFSDIDATGVVGTLSWECIASTPTMEEFVITHKQEIYDKLVAEAKTLLKLN